MFAKDQYLAWARRHYGKVPYDLATSGMPTVPASELGAPAGALDDPTGWDAFRAAIARYNDVPAREAIATLGASHALWLAYATLLEPGDEVLVETPGYEPLWRTAEGVGAKVLRFERPAAEGYSLDPARVARAMTPRTRLIVVSNLHNPSGIRAPEGTLRALADLAASRGAHLLVDEVYAPFGPNRGPPATFGASARKLGANVVVAASLTKCYGLGPDRFGWMLASEDVILRAEDAMTACCGMLPLAHAHLGVHAFARLPELSARATRLLGKKRERIQDWIGTRPDLTWSAPREGLFGFAVSSRAGDLMPVIEEGARSEGVLVAAGAFFGVPNGFRLAWSIPEEKLAEGLTRLGRVLPG